MVQQDHIRPVNTGILVLDYGSQYTLLIARRLREIGVYAEVIDGTADKPPSEFHFYGVILSGGPDSAHEESARTLPSWVLECKKPILGICYGMQLIAQSFGGKLRSGTSREYGQTSVNLKQSLDWPTWLLPYQALESHQDVWMSHGDDIENLPEAFVEIASTKDKVVAIHAHSELPILGLQFHPEVQHTPNGKKILSIFAADICKAEINWSPADVLDATLQQIRDTVGPGAGKVLMAVSGGVDSTVAISLMSKALGKDRVQGVFIDHGLLRQDEAKWVSEKIKALGVNLETLDCSENFFAAIEGIDDPEEKRKVIGRQFIHEFEAYAAARKNDNYTHLGQGTLYPDVIESAGHGAGSKVIKSHHNVGGLPENLNLQLAEPFRYLFKDEVRLIGDRLGIPAELVHRHPFPGPGLAIRILGSIDPEKVAILQKADAIFVNRLKKDGYYDKVWQAFAVLLPVKTVGVMGDNRTYQWTLALRAVTASDGMTAGVGDLPMPFLVSVGDDIVRKVDGINRVVYDITTKPPATIEWE